MSGETNMVSGLFNSMPVPLWVKVIGMTIKRSYVVITILLTPVLI